MPLVTDDLSSIDLQQLKHCSNWQQQFRLLTQWGLLIARKPALRTDSHKVKGCATDAWLTHSQEGKKHYFYFDSDSKIICGLAAVVLVFTNGKTQEQIRQCEMDDLLQELGIRNHLTPSRSNGIREILRRIKQLGVPLQNQADEL